MKEISILLDRALGLIKDPSLKDAATLARLAPIPAKLEHLRSQWVEMQSELGRIDDFLDELVEKKSPPTRTNGETFRVLSSNRPSRKKQTKLHIDLDATFLGGQRVTISDQMASRSFASFFALLYKLRGVSVLETLATFRVNRAPLVSRNPHRDYRYQSRGQETHYSYEPIADSGFFVLTTNTTTEKADAIRGAWKALGFPNDKLKVSVVEKPDLLSDWLA